jgi:hypothetical protein
MLSAPTNGSSFPAPATLSLVATVVSNANVIQSVSFYNWGTNLIASVINPPYAYSWTNVGAGSYGLMARLAYGAGSTLDSATSTVTVTNCPPLGIKTQPHSQVSAPGGSASFSVVATNATGYQWRFNGGDMPSRTNATLSLTNLQIADFETYTVLVRNACGSILSQPAQLILAAQPMFTTAGINLSTFSITFTTEVGPVYRVEYQDELAGPVWYVLASVRGTGAPITITDNAATNTSRFYRVHVQ